MNLSDGEKLSIDSIKVIDFSETLAVGMSTDFMLIK